MIEEDLYDEPGGILHITLSKNPEANTVDRTSVALLSYIPGKVWISRLYLKE